MIIGPGCILEPTEPTAKYLPSGENASEKGLGNVTDRCSVNFNISIGLHLKVSNIVIVPFSLVYARYLPSLEKVTELISVL